MDVRTTKIMDRIYSDYKLLERKVGSTETLSKCLENQTMRRDSSG